MGTPEPDATVDRQPRHAHWLELFFDLVMVAFVGVLAHRLHGAPTAFDFATFIVLFFPAWWAWCNVTITMNLFGAVVTPKIWALVSIAMLAVGIMAAAVPEGLTERAGAYAAGNAVIRLVILIPWWMERRRVGVPWYRTLAYNGLTAFIWAVSIVVPQPAQFVLWGVAIGIEVILLVFLGRQRTWLRDALDIDHIAERVGLFVVIVFGESILSIVAELDHAWNALSGVTAALAFTAISALAFAFFQYGARSAENGWRRLQRAGDIRALRDTVMYLPFVLVVGIVMLAAGLGTAVAEAAHRLPVGATVCIAIGIVLFYAANATISLRYGDAARSVARWGTVGVLLPLGLFAVAAVADAVVVVAATVVVIGVMIASAEISRRRSRSSRVSQPERAIRRGRRA
ncbi:MAG: low temperature requirement protein A [Leifsonia sp.]